MFEGLIDRLDTAFYVRRWKILAALSAAFLVVTLVRVYTTPFQPDEVLTVLTSQLPSQATIWAALADGADHMPPLYPFVARVLHLPFGEGLLITRLPAIAGFWLAALVVFVIVRRRASGLSAFAAAMMLVVVAYPYVVEARGYVPAMACAAVALYAWTEAASQRRRLPHIVLLGTALAAAAWWQAASWLIVWPLVAGELARVRRTRRPDWLLWGVIVAASFSALPLVLLGGLPSATPAATADPGFLARWFGAYVTLLAPLNSWLIVLGGLVAVGMTLVTIVMLITNREVDLDTRPMPAHELVVAVGLLFLPALAVMAGEGSTARDLLFTAPGLTVVVMLLIYKLTPRVAIADVALAFTLALTVTGVALMTFLPSRLAFHHPVRSRPALVRALDDTERRVALGGGPLALQLLYYSGKERPGRAVVLAEPSLARENGGDEALNRRELALAKWTTADLEPFFPFVAITKSLLVYDAGQDWLAPKLRQLSVSMTETARETGGTLYAVSLKPMEPNPRPATTATISAPARSKSPARSSSRLKGRSR
jgi:hypothetical protein